MYQQAFRRVSRNQHGGFPLQHPFGCIQSQLGFAGGSVGSVAVKALVSQDRSNIPIERDDGIGRTDGRGERCCRDQTGSQQTGTQEYPSGPSGKSREETTVVIRNVSHVWPSISRRSRTSATSQSEPFNNLDANVFPIRDQNGLMLLAQQTGCRMGSRVSPLMVTVMARPVRRSGVESSPVTGRKSLRAQRHHNKR